MLCKCLRLKIFKASHHILEERCVLAEKAPSGEKRKDNGVSNTLNWSF